MHIYTFLFFFLMIRRPPRSTLFPYTRSSDLHKKSARRRGAWICFQDESGFSLLPVVRATWAPRGQTPVLDHRFSWTDRKSTRLNSSHSSISYAVFCLKKKKINHIARNTLK